MFVRGRLREQVTDERSYNRGLDQRSHFYSSNSSLNMLTAHSADRICRRLHRSSCRRLHTHQSVGVNKKMNSIHHLDTDLDSNAAPLHAAYS